MVGNIVMSIHPIKTEENNYVPCTGHSAFYPFA